MKRVFGIMVVASVAVSTLTTLAFAQHPAETRVMVQQMRIQGPEGPPPMPPGKRFRESLSTENYGRQNGFYPPGIPPAPSAVRDASPNTSSIENPKT